MTTREKLIKQRDLFVKNLSPDYSPSPSGQGLVNFGEMPLEEDTYDNKNAEEMQDGVRNLISPDQPEGIRDQIVVSQISVRESQTSNKNPIADVESARNVLN